MNTERVPSIKVLTFTFEPTLGFISKVACMENTLEGLREVIGCRCVACTEIKVGGKKYDVWSNDEALLQDAPFPSLFISDDLILFGNLVFAKHDEEGATIGLSSAEVALLKKFIQQQNKNFQMFVFKGVF